MRCELTNANERKLPNKGETKNRSSNEGGEALDDAIQDDALSEAQKI
jgi:hypothetical protein